MALIVYVLCALTSLACSVLLLRSYAQTRTRLLLWSGLCFAGLFLNNLLLVIDAQMGPNVDLSLYRLLPALAAIMLLLYGLIWESHR